ncbi:MAG TPA: UDP-N-acetylglucosamine 2-epimerase (non-hydrolyzing) [Polyangia bacterium]|nr:UDP-N-acetylglucosamine 2-epimerase (non-hydrolyzing) [Polyangia bacterium]
MSAAPVPKALFIYGTRPEAIKLAPVIAACRQSGRLEVVLCATAQHRQLLDEINDTFGLRPDFDLGLMQPDQTLTALTARAVTAIGEVLAAVRPALGMIQGDTTTALAGALASFYQRIPVAHVEAGLRTYDLARPFPEEMNRQMVARVVRWNFAPTEGARENLRREGIADATIAVTGNTAIDALRMVVAADGPATSADALAAVGVPPLETDQRLVLVTAHRRESFGEGFRDLCRGLRAAVDRWPQLRVVYPVHPNPNVRAPVGELLGDHERIHLVDPVSYRPFVRLLRSAWLVLTDSGGIQEEAPGLGKPVLILRDTTERPEAVAAGTARLVGTVPARILDAIADLTQNPASYRAMASAHNPFGDGHAAERIVARLLADIDPQTAGGVPGVTPAAR